MSLLFPGRPPRDPRPCSVCTDSGGVILTPSGESITCSLCRGTGEMQYSWADMQEQRPDHIGPVGGACIGVLALGIAIAGFTGVGPSSVGQGSAASLEWTNAEEDDEGFDCRYQGNHICGPGSAHEAGCYSGGVLVERWNETDHYGQVNPPC